jgi:hypothetical protein
MPLTGSKKKPHTKFSGSLLSPRIDRDHLSPEFHLSLLFYIFVQVSSFVLISS